ncbi:MAG: tripartite tricarboxylate transporter substrate binding protein [Alcaligenaceae bacterium]
MIKLLFALTLVVYSQFSVAAPWPEKSIKLIVPFPPGGGTDIVARTIAAQLSTRLGQTVVVENRPGAGGTIGANAVAMSEPDGYTIGIATSSTHPAAVVLRNDLPYNPIQSFAPITQIGSTAYVLVASPELPAKNLETFIEYAKQNPGKLNFANVGASTLGYLVSLQFEALTGIKLAHITYKGSAQAYPDLIAGRASVFFDNPGASTALVNTQKLNAYGVTIATPELKDVPLFSLAGKGNGLHAFDTPFWYGLVAPAATPRAIVERIQQEVEKYVQSDSGKVELAAFSLQPVGSTPAQFAERIRLDTEQFKALALQVDLKP